MAKIESFQALLSDFIRPDIDKTDDSNTCISTISIIQIAASKKTKV